ncbi:hypothetical protein LIER_27218 [Lithospermum erythrorhizon]|uniref:Retrovirus-related Pol polyprotein from transposon TNT 1-94 n=1 Tax=Lithospermum erythrorhizon TaxID=34254 RepID=A0AAV3RFB3_LITER
MCCDKNLFLTPIQLKQPMSIALPNGPNFDKLQPRAYKAVFLGYVPTQKAIFPFQFLPKCHLCSHDVTKMVVIKLVKAVNTDEIEEVTQHVELNESSSAPEPVRKSTRPKIKSSWLQDYVNTANTSSSTVFTSPHVPATIPFVDVPQSLSDHSAFLANIVYDREPTSYKKASTSPKWIEATEKELKALTDT